MSSIHSPKTEQMVGAQTLARSLPCTHESPNFRSVNLGSCVAQLEKVLKGDGYFWKVIGVEPRELIRR